MNFDADLLLDSYIKIVAKNDRMWLNEHDELFLMRSVKRILNLILQTNFENSRNRYKIALNHFVYLNLKLL